MGDGNEGRKEVLAAIDQVGVGEPPADEDEQLSMLAPQPLMPAKAEDGSVPSRREPGRPAGAKNKRTEAWVSYLLGQYRSPLVFLAETYSRDLSALVVELACSKREAFELMLNAAVNLAPYMHQKLPIAVEATNKSAGVLLVVAPGSQEAQVAAAMGVDLFFAAAPQEPKENQDVIEGKTVKSDTDQSDEYAKCLICKDFQVTGRLIKNQLLHVAPRTAAIALGGGVASIVAGAGGGPPRIRSARSGGDLLSHMAEFGPRLASRRERLV